MHLDCEFEPPPFLTSPKPFITPLQKAIQKTRSPGVTKTEAWVATGVADALEATRTTFGLGEHEQFILVVYALLDTKLAKMTPHQRKIWYFYLDHLKGDSQTNRNFAKDVLQRYIDSEMVEPVSFSVT